MFFQGFLKHPVMVGSIVPSSDRLIRKMLGPVDWANTKLFVEYGPGVGTFCRSILERMAPDAQFIAIDTNPDFIRSEEHTSEIQSLMRLSYAGFCLKKKTQKKHSST